MTYQERNPSAPRPPRAQGIPPAPPQRGPRGIGDVMASVDRAKAAAARADRIALRSPDAYEEPEWAELTPPEQATPDWMPSRLRWATLDDFTGPVAQALTEWSVNPAGRNLVLSGPVGVGKTHAAVAACRPGADQGIHTVFLPAVELFERLRPDGPPRMLWDLMEVDRLIIDDVGAERATDWSIDRLYALVNRRWLEERPTVVTTNLDPRTDLEGAIRADTFSRLVGSGAVVLGLGGDDRRRKKAGA